MNRGRPEIRWMNIMVAVVFGLGVMTGAIVSARVAEAASLGEAFAILMAAMVVAVTIGIAGAELKSRRLR